MVKRGLYQHFKGGVYRVLGTANHSETGGQLVVYQSVESGVLWARPLQNFQESVEASGYQGPRFWPIDSEGGL